MGKVNSGWQNFMDKSKPFRETVAKIAWSIKFVISTIAKWIYKLRSVLLSIPVLVVAIRFALENKERLPEEVGINLLANGEFQMMVSRDVAIMGPFALTVLCLMLMFLSRRVLYPWVISIFTLVLPWVVYITNIFPA